MYKCYYGSMYKKKNIVTRISLEARKKLAKLSKEKGITNIDIIDYILGTSSKINLQKLKQDEDKMWENYLKKMKETGMGSLPDVNRDPELNARPSPELADFKSSFGIYRKTLLGNTDIPIRNVSSAPKTVLDSAILMTWKDIPTKSQKSRKQILKAVRTKMEKGWSNLYRSWYKNHTDHNSTFKQAVDNRLKALLKAGILERVLLKGTYQLARTLSKDEWDIVTGVDKLPAQKGLVIPNLLSSR